jgi:DNA ligase-1
MKDFAALLDRLSYSPARNDKLRLISEYLARTPDPDRGWALAALTEGLPFSLPVRRILSELVAPQVDPELYRLSRDYVGDTAETVALLWRDNRAEDRAPPRLSDVVETLTLAGRTELPVLLTRWLDALDVTGRWALLKLLTGALRVGVSARLAKTAAARIGHRQVNDIEEIWHGLDPPYVELFAWLERRGGRPEPGAAPAFRPMMLAHPLDEAEIPALAVTDFLVEWKWDGIRVQAVRAGSEVRLYSRTGEDVSRAFPDVALTLSAQSGGDIALDGELLVVRPDGAVAPFNDLQQRLNRKIVSKRLMETYPGHLRLYDALMIDGEDLRARALDQRRQRLEAWYAAHTPSRTSLSELLCVSNRAELEALWRSARESGIEGLMLKRRASPYLAGRPKGHWYKLKRAALTLDCVLMYAQRGSGKRSSYYSDYTFGTWTEDESGAPLLVPVGKAYSGFSDEELLKLDRWVRNNTMDRFGPVRAVRPGLVLEVAFDAAHPSARHKSGVAMRFPRIHRIRWDKPADEADRLDTLMAMIDGTGGRAVTES